MRTIRILLADDHAVVRQALRALLGAEPDLQVIGEAADGLQAVALAGEHLPDIVLMDLAMPVLNGIEASRRISRETPGPKIIVLSSYTEDEHLRQAIQAGVCGYLAKQAAAMDLVRAIREVYAGSAYFSPDIARRLRDQSRQALWQGRGSSTELTQRELEVLCLIAQSYSNKEVGSALGISVKTVEKHRQQVMNKLRIHDVAGLTLYASNKGMLRPAPEQSLPSSPDFITAPGTKAPSGPESLLPTSTP